MESNLDYNFRLVRAKNFTNDFTGVIVMFSPKQKQQLSSQPQTFTIIICDFERPNALPFLHREGLNPCIPPAQRTDSTPSCAWFGTSLIGNRALIRTWRALLDSSQRNTGQALLAAENGRTPLCPTSSFFFLSFSCVRKKPWQEKRHSSSWLRSSCLRQGVRWESRDNNLQSVRLRGVTAAE